MMTIEIFILTVNIASILTCRYVAKRHNASPVFWGVMGALFGPFSIPFVFFAKPETHEHLMKHH